jgi:hypothetical protein
MSVSQAFHVIAHPWRVGIDSFLAVAKVVKMPEADARDEWAEAKTKGIYKKAGIAGRAR